MNNTIFFFFYSLAHQSIFFDKVIVFFAVYFPYIVILLALIFLFFYNKSRKEFILICFSGGLALAVAEILKFLFHTLRPFAIFPQVLSLFLENGYAFPSGHAAVFSAMAFALFFTHKKAGYVFMFFAFLIGLARIIAGVHFPIDILGGFIIGILVAYFVKNR